jgi:1,4-alpha-glucan branching enzyme
MKFPGLRAPVCALLVCSVACVGDVASERRGVESSTHSLTASSHGGMGATVYAGGVSFRVWAPEAAQVWVSGDFNGWGRSELGNEFNGNFSIDVPFAVRYQRYKYIIKNQWGQEEYKADPRAQRMENSTGASIIHDPNTYSFRAQQFALPGRDEQVVYELHVGSFYDAPGGGPGNFRSAQAKLDYLRDLGVNMLELMPVFEFPGDFSWGYNPSYPFAPESAYGTPDDLKWLIDEAHMRGIGVIMDVVHSHYGPSDLSMWCFSGDCLGAGGEYFFGDYRAQTPWGNTRPDYGRREIRDFIRDHSQMLLHEYRADGLRWDATKYIRSVNGDDSLASGWDVLRSVSDSKNAEQPWKLMIAEDFGAGNSITQATAAGGAGFDSQWAAEFVNPVRNALINASDDGRDLNAVRDAITQKYNGQAAQRTIYVESHDEAANGRLTERIWPGRAASWAAKKRSTLGAAILLTSPGVPLLFSGQEILEDGAFAAEDPIDWGKANTYAGITQLYRDLIHLRRNFQNNTRGLRGEGINVFHVNNNDKVLAYHRYQQGGAGDDVIIVANFSGRSFANYDIGLPRQGIWYVRFNSDWNGYSGDFGNTYTADVWTADGGKDGLGYHGSLALGPYSAVILSQ